MRCTIVLFSLLFTLTANAVEPLQCDLNPSNYVPFATYHDVGSNQYFYYDDQKATFFVYEGNQAPVTQTTQVTSGDPSGLLETVNQYRASKGLHAWLFDGHLYNSAINNNAWQRIRGMGHHDVPGAQNSAWGPQDILSVLHMWANSPGHAATLFGGYTFGAIAFDGVFWTLNAR